MLAVKLQIRFRSLCSCRSSRFRNGSGGTAGRLCRSQHAHSWPRPSDPERVSTGYFVPRHSRGCALSRAACDRDREFSSCGPISLTLNNMACNPISIAWSRPTPRSVCIHAPTASVVALWIACQGLGYALAFEQTAVACAVKINSALPFAGNIGAAD